MSDIQIGQKFNIVSSATYEASINETILVENTLHTITLPINPINGCFVYLHRGVDSSNSITIQRNGKRINGKLNNIRIDSNKNILLIYTTENIGWLVHNHLIGAYL